MVILLYIILYNNINLNKNVYKVVSKENQSTKWLPGPKGLKILKDAKELQKLLENNLCSEEKGQV